MNQETLIMVLTWIGIGCWVICFCWMFSISRRQNALLKALHDQGKRIERLSKEEHELIQEVHPAVNEIRDTVEQAVHEGAGRKRD